MREMTGTELISRRASDFSYHLASSKLVKSRSNLELTAHGRSDHRTHDRHTHGGQRSSEKSNSGSLTTSRKNSRLGQRGTESILKSQRSRSKDASGVSNSQDTSRTGVSASILPPISGHQISNAQAKNGGISPRNNTDSCAPTRLAVRNSSSPENIVGKAPDTIQSHSGVERTSCTPPVTGHSLVRNGSSNNVVNAARSAQVISPESHRVPDTSRFSPINCHDKPKVKFEKKVMKQLVDESVPSSPRAYKISSAELGNQQQPPSSRDGKGKQRRPSIKSLPKIAPSEEPFSVRRKIEQFRKWHEEHYADALKSSGLQEEAPTAANGGGEAKSPEGVDFAKILEDNIVQNQLSTTERENVTGITNDTDKSDINGNIVDKAKNSLTKEVGKNVRSKLRPKSGATWKTWRDVNQSDAYDDVDKYIKDNDLMDKQREKWIQTWICDVRTAMAESDETCMDEG